MALFQGPFFYYHTSGFIKIILLSPYALFGLCFSIYIFIKLIKYKNTTTVYHIVGLSCAFIIGLLTVTNNTMEFLDFNLRKNERNKIVEEIKSGALKSGHLDGYNLFPISNDGNDINIIGAGKGIISVEFYIDRGFIDHASIFLYTNDPEVIKELKGNYYSTEIATVKKLADNWYRVGY